MKDYTRKTTRARAGRAGMTLIEILIAMGILAMGLFGVLSLFPVAIRNVGMSVNRTRAVGIAEDAIYSMRNKHLDMRMLSDMVSRTGNENADTERFTVATSIAPQLSDLTGMRSFPHLIQWFMAQKSQDAVGWGCPAGTGKLPGPTFKIGDPKFLFYNWNPQDDQADNAGFVPVLEYDHLSDQWMPSQFGWTASFLPLDADFDAQTSYRVQVAVWRNYDLRYGSDDTNDPRYRELSEELEGDGTQPEVVLNRPVPEARPGDYFRVDMHGVWYRIESVEEDNGHGVVNLVAPFRHPAGAGAFDPGSAPDPLSVSIASSNRLIGIYDSLLTPEK